MADSSKLHIVMFPWLAIGHLIPFLELSKSLASKGHHVSFLSTPRNIQRLPKLPLHLSSLISLVDLPFPLIENLPENAQSSTDIPVQKTQLLKRAFDGLQPHVSKFLENANTPIDWIIYDYASHWLPPLAAKLNIPCVFFSLFNAAVLSFFGPSWALLNPEEARTTPESYTTVPKWIPFRSNIVYRMHELLQNFEGAPEDLSIMSEDSVPDAYRFGISIRDCEFIAIRSCVEFEPEWINLLTDINKKSVIPVGSLHPLVQESENEDNASWVIIREWLEKQKDESVVYVALGTEAVLSWNQVNELALGLERSGLPFIWVLRTPPESDVDVLQMLPDGFEDRVKVRGLVWTSWAPQVKILGHRSIGGFLTHCGWNSLIEGLGFGRVPILLPMLNDQGLNARLLEGKGFGFEVPRNELDGWFTSESVAESLGRVMVDKEGQYLRNNAKVMRGVFGNANGMGICLNNFISYLQARKKQHGRKQQHGKSPTT